MIDFGTVRPGTTLYIPFATYDSNDPTASVTTTGLATTDIEVYKDGGTTARASDSGYALLGTDGIDEYGTGVHGISVNLADNTTAGFYAAGAQYWVVLASITVDAGTVNGVLATFRIGMPDAVLNTTIATLASQTSFTLTKGPAEDSALVGCVCYIHDVASEVQGGYAVISAYTGSSKTVTLTAGTTFTAAATDNISIYPPVNPKWFGAVAVTGRDIGANVLLSSGTGTGQLDFTSGVVKSNVTQAGGSTVAAGAIPNAAAGAAGGLFIAGTNAATTITTAGGAALTLSSTGSNGSALVATGNGSGHGIIATGGATGDGLRALGGATSGDGFHTEAQTSGDGCHFVGAGNGHGFLAVGAGTGEGAHWTGGATGHGIHAEGVGANSHGALFQRGGAGGDDMAFQNNDVTIATVSSVTAIATGGIAAASFAAGAIDAAAIANGAIDSATFASGAIDAAAIAANAIDAATFAADVDAEIAAMVWNAATATYGSAGSYGEKVEALNTGAVTVSSIGNDVITAAAIAADAGTEIGTAVWATATRVLTANTNLNDPSAATIADAVWDELATGHTDAGKAGQQLWTDVDAILADTGTDGVITASLGTQAKADVNAEVLDVISTDTVAEPGSVPAANAPLDEKVSWLYMLSRNRVTQTATAQKIYADDGTTEEASAAVSDNGTTFERSEWTTT